MENRREHTKLTQPLDGRYRGMSGASSCRIMDISWGGCFIETVTTPTRDEHTIIVIPIGEGRIGIGGRVLYVDRGIGFAVRFDRLTVAQLDALKQLLGDPPPSVRPVEAVGVQSIGKT